MAQTVETAVDRPKAVVVMAAGLGTRMRSATVKVLHPVAGRPMIHYPVQSALELGAVRVVVVLGHQRERVEGYLRDAFPGAPIEVAVQAEQRGTADAVRSAEAALAGFDGDVFILSGDVPTLPTDTIRALDRNTAGATVGVLGMRLGDPGHYGRLVRSDDGRLLRIVEFRDAGPDVRALDEVNAGVYRVDAKFLFETLARLDADNAQGEYYLTDIVAEAVGRGGAAAWVLDGADAADAGGVNDRIDLAAAERRLQRRIAHRLMAAGVTLRDPARVSIDDGVEIGADTVIEPGVMLCGRTRIGAGCTIEMDVRVVDAEIGDGAHIRAGSYIEEAKVGPDCQVGPYARLRTGTVLEAEAKVGNFVETKKAVLGRGAKASHLSYLGDATIGAGANIGAGTITCNYDGVSKFETRIGAGAFIGSDTQLVAPVSVGDGAFVGAGSTITQDVPADALALSRGRQAIIAGWAARRRATQAAEKAARAAARASETEAKKD